MNYTNEAQGATMSGPSQPQDTPVADARQKAGAHPTAPPPPPSRPGSGHGIIPLCLAAASFATAPFLLLLPVAGFVPAFLAAAGVVFAWIGLRGTDRGTGLAVAGLIASVVLFGLTVVPSVSDYPELQKVLGLIAGALLVASGLLLRRRRSWRRL